MFPTPVEDFLYIVADIGILAAFVLAVAFLVSYTSFFHWRKTSAGRSLVYVFMSLIAVSALGALSRFVGQDYFGRGLLRVLVWCAVPIALGHLLWVLWSNWFHQKPPIELQEKEEHRRHTTGPISLMEVNMTDDSTTPTPPTIWYKGQRVLRTAFTTTITVLPLVPQIIAIVQGQWQAEWLTAVAVQAVAINTALTRIIAIPKVNEWLTKVGLGSVPKSALVETVAGTGVKPDPKAVDYR